MLPQRGTKFPPKYAAPTLTIFGEWSLKELGFPVTETEAYANRVIEETLEPEEYFEELIDNTQNRIRPSLNEHFITLEGFEKKEMPAVKSYGLMHPSLIRVYAIEMTKQCYIIFHSGIKIGRNLSQSPGLKDIVLKKARALITFLNEKGICNPLILNQAAI